MAGNTEAGSSLTNGSVAATDPYETDPQRIPKDDPYFSQSPCYGRYMPRDGDFRPRYDSWYQPDPDKTAYWEDFVKKSCVPENNLNVAGPRQSFAIGSVAVSVDADRIDEVSAERYSRANANELSAARKAEDALRENGVSVPTIYFCGTVEGKNTTVESRVPGVSLEVAWKYLSDEQIASIRSQCRHIVQLLAAVDCTSDGPSYICSGLNAQSPPGVSESERKVLFQEKSKSENLCFVHNNMTPSNIIVKNDRVVGITNWRQCGLFGFDRADKIHRSFRCPESEGTQAWIDLYSDLLETAVKGIRDSSEIPVKTEPTAMSLEKLPISDDVDTKSVLSQLDGADPIDDHPTPKKIANLKQGLASRASSSDRSSPANSIKGGVTTGKKSAASSKKGTAKKPTTKKRKANDQDGDSVDGGRRSNTPSSHTSRTPAPKKQSSASVTGSPAPEPKRKGSKPIRKKNDVDDGEVFCICRKPDNHTWMIGCDGDCEDWFHGKCVNIDQRDAELIDRYFCPSCHERGLGRTGWKPMCRLPECRKPARTSRTAPSKYCSDDHGREFMRRKTQHFELGRDKTPDEIGSKGGVLTASELKAAIMNVSSVEEFRRLGERIVSPPEEEEEEEKPNPTNGEATGTITVKKEKKLGLDVDAKGLTYTPDEAAKLDKLRKQRDELLHRQDMLHVRDKFVVLVRQRSRNILERLKQLEPKGGWKDICGYDSRVAWSDEEFDKWRLSPVGEKSLNEGVLDAAPSQKQANGTTDTDGDTVMNGNEDDSNSIETLARGVCIKKRCERHKQWLKVHQDDILFEQNTAKQDVVRCEEEAQTVVERAVLRVWAEMDNAHVGGV